MLTHNTSSAPLRNDSAHVISNNLTHAVIDQIECGLLVCDSAGRMLHANRAARRELEAGSVLKATEGAVRCDERSQAELSAAIHAAATRQRRRLLRVGGSGGLLLAVMPLDLLAGDALALLMIGRRALCSTLGLELLAMLYRLTLAEQRVLRGLIASRPAREIARENGVAMSTVRSQIQSIRDKLGACNIDELLLTAAQVPPVTSWH